MKAQRTAESSPERWRRVRLTVFSFVAVIVLLLVLDSLVGLAYHTSTTVSVTTSRPSSAPVDEALVVFPGYASDGKSVSDAFGTYLHAEQAMIVVSYAQRGINDAELYRKVMTSLTDLAPRSLRILAGSMGGIVAARFLSQYAKDFEAVRFRTVVLTLDTAPVGPQDIRRPRWMSSLSSWYRGGPLTSVCWAVLDRFAASPQAEAGANRRAIEEGNQANASVGIPALTSQAAYIASFEPGEIGRIRSVVTRVTYLEASSPQEDPLVRVSNSITHWREILPDLMVTNIPGRQGKWHVPWTYRPRETLEAAEKA